jgi:hypothetical protein
VVVVLVVMMVVVVTVVVVVMAVAVVLVAAWWWRLPVSLVFVSKSFFITCLSRSRKFRGRLLELHSPKVITVP